MDYIIIFKQIKNTTLPHTYIPSDKARYTGHYLILYPLANSKEKETEAKINV